MSLKDLVQVVILMENKNEPKEKDAIDIIIDEIAKNDEVNSDGEVNIDELIKDVIES